MGVLIKNMKKPTWCYELIDGEFKYCPFVNNDGNCILLPENDICNDTWEDMYSKCLLVEVPKPHGRLIDADALADDLDYDANHCEEDREMKSNCASWLRSNATPTIIEAEGE